MCDEALVWGVVAVAVIVNLSFHDESRLVAIEYKVDAEVAAAQGVIR
ncbi:MAG: hypothetical protein KJ749_01950 [Planctomycetes bacterium]|nr:hypothetical protein [Planctomycetota bacterium]